MRILSCLIALCLLGLLGSCDFQEQPGDDTLRVVATIFAPYDFARAVAGGLAGVTMLLPPAGESHSFEPTPRDVIAIRRCDVFIYVGGESDAWVERILSGMDTSRMRVVTLMDCVDTVEEAIIEGMQAGNEYGGEELDEHVWTSPKNAALITRKIAAAMCAADPRNAEQYRQNTLTYLAELDALDAAFQSLVGGAARRTIAFGDRFPFRYFTDAYGLDYCAAFPGCSAETEAGAKTVIFLIEKIRAEGIPVVFHTELSNRSMAGAIAGATGAQVRQLHACHNISREDFAAGRTYLDLMEENLEALRAALY
ncbi:MAG: metal ABC transporter substrate-binding protein [Oscillospiraceae bacterium]|nr:metal ABC transporter substrate-binding protein [Oscillospiraceae bacterium]